MNKKTLCRVVFGICCVSMLSFLVIKEQIINKKLEQIARPSRLFNLQMIESKMPSRPDWGVKISADHDKFFYVVSQQALHWMGRGENSFIFSTADQRYVTKFLPVGRLQESNSHGFFQKLFSKKTQCRKNLKKLDDLCMSARVCFDDLQDETGVVYVHLNPTQGKIHGLKLIDSFGQSQRVCGDDTCFIAQKRAKALIPVLTDLMDRGDFEGAKIRVNQVFELLISLARKGYIDGDDGLIANNNIGFLEDRAIYIDTFHFFRAKKLDLVERMCYEFQLRLLPLERWLNQTYPNLGAYYLQKRDEVMGVLAIEKTARRSESSLLAHGSVTK